MRQEVMRYHLPPMAGQLAVQPLVTSAVAPAPGGASAARPGDPLRPNRSGPSPSSETWIPQLDGLRGIAALIVVLAHYHPGPVAPSPTSFYGLVLWLQAWSLAPLSVVLFYGLSAFLLTYLAVREHDARGSVSLRRFYTRRIMRIWPLYGTLVLANFITAAPGGPIGPPYGGNPDIFRWMVSHGWLYLGFISNWSLAFNYVGGHVDMSSPGISVLWSIAVEEQFYLLFPLLLLVALGSTRRSLAVLLGTLLTAFLFRVVFYTVIRGDHDELVNNNIRLYYATASYLDTFAFGALFGWLAARRPPAAAVVARVFRVPGVGFVLLAALGYLAANWSVAWQCRSAACLSGLYAVVGLVLALTIVWSVASSRSVVSRLAASPPLRLLGLLSFGIYCWHPIAQAAIEQIQSRVVQPSSETGALLTFAIYVVATFFVASVTYGCVERPFLVLKDRLNARTASRTPHPRWWLVAGVCVPLLALLHGLSRIV